MLLAALQRRRRGIHIRSMLLPTDAPLELTLAELRAVRNTSMDANIDQLRVHPKLYAPPVTTLTVLEP